jgi:hypothetical protein
MTTTDTQPTGAHTLTLDKTAHETPQGVEVTFRLVCTCGWAGDEYGTDIARTATFWSADPGLCQLAAVEQGAEHAANAG